MKVLFLRRQRIGGIASYSSALAEALVRRGIEVDIEDADRWIPNETGSKPDSKVTPQLKKKAENYHAVHAFGYRSAWACGAAFRSNAAWFYSAYDMPKTTHELLIDKLNEAQAGICSSRAVYRALDEAIAIDLVTEPPGILATEKSSPRIGESGQPVIAAIGRLTPEKGFEALIHAMERVWEVHPDAQLSLATVPSFPARPEYEKELRDALAKTSRPDQIRLAGELKDKAAFFREATIFVVPSRRAGFSMAALEAMSAGIPVLLRRTGGLPEIIDPDISGMLFDDDESLGETINEMLSLPMTLEAISRAAPIRVEELFDIDHHAIRIEQIYRDVLE